MRKRALVVAIDRYADPAVPPLSGCKADAADVASLLTSRLGFPGDSVRMLADEQATGVLILDGLSWLRDGAVAGDQLWFSFSGHGVRVPDDDWDEWDEDKVDEAFCPHDFAVSNPGATALRDDVMSSWVGSLAEDVKVLGLLDCCHSGTGSRDAPQPPSVPVLGRRFVPLPGSTPGVSSPMLSRRPVPLRLRPHRADVLFLSACGPLQVAHEIGLDGKARGAMTAAFGLEVRSNPRMGRARLLDGIEGRLDAWGIRQTPGYEGTYLSGGLWRKPRHRIEP